MAIGRISTYGLHQATLSNALKAQNDIANAQIQISSGLKAKTYSELSGEVEIFSALENKLSKIDTYLQNNRQVQARMDTANLSLSQIIEVANNMKNLIAQRRNATLASSISFEQQIKAGFDSVAQQLNTNVDGRYLFAGTRTDVKPVNDATFYKTVTEGEPDSGYYQGSGEDITARIDDGREVNYNVRADNDAFQKIFSALSLAQKGHQLNDDTLLIKAYDQMQEAVYGVINVQAEANTTYSIIDKVNDRHVSQQVYWKGLKEETVNADIVALSTKVAVDQGVLQATFQSFARINSLQLSEFL